MARFLIVVLLVACSTAAHAFAPALSYAEGQTTAEEQFDLADRYFAGDGVAKDPVAAVAWYAGAQFNLGGMYYFGDGVAQDIAKAAEWFTRAAEQGHPSAQFNLAVMYSTGVGVAADIVQAYAWADRAASGGEPNAGRLRDSLKQKMTAEQIADAARGARADESSTKLTKQHAVTQSDCAAAVKSAQSKR